VITRLYCNCGISPGSYTADAKGEPLSREATMTMKRGKKLMIGAALVAAVVVAVPASALAGARLVPAKAHADRSDFCIASHPMVEELAIFERGEGTADLCRKVTQVSYTTMQRIAFCSRTREGWGCSGRIANPARFPRHVRLRSGETYRIKWWQATHPVYRSKHWIATARRGRTVVRWSIDDVGVLGDY
jgi:hypothetical protein